MKKQYNYPETEIIPLSSMGALCTSGGGGGSGEIGGGDNGNDPWSGAHAPKQAPTF